MKTASTLHGVLLILLTANGHAHSAESTLAKAGELVAKNLPRGTLVTAEWIEGKPVYASYGPDIPTAVAPEHILFEIGSVSKVFTGLLLAKTIHAGKATLETTLGQVLGPEQTFRDPKVAQITLKQLVTHRSGLPRMPDNSDFTTADPYATYTTKMLQEWLAQITLSSKGPHPYLYSNVGMATLGHALEKIWMQKWDKLVTTHLLQPLHMHGATYTFIDANHFQLEGVSWKDGKSAPCGPPVIFTRK